MSWILEDMSPKHFIMYIEEPIFRRQMQQPVGPGQPSIIFQGCQLRSQTCQKPEQRTLVSMKLMFLTLKNLKLFLVIYFILFVSLFYLHACLYSICVQCLWRLEEGTKTPGAGVLDNWWLPCGFWVLQKEEQSALSYQTMFPVGIFQVFVCLKEYIVVCVGKCALVHVWRPQAYSLDWFSLFTFRVGSGQQTQVTRNVQQACIEPSHWLSFQFKILMFLDEESVDKVLEAQL